MISVTLNLNQTITNNYVNQGVEKNKTLCTNFLDLKTVYNFINGYDFISSSGSASYRNR